MREAAAAPANFGAPETGCACKWRTSSLRSRAVGGSTLPAPWANTRWERRASPRANSDRRLPSQPVDAQIVRPLPHHHGLDAWAVKPEKLLEGLRVAIRRYLLEKIIHKEINGNTAWRRQITYKLWRSLLRLSQTPPRVLAWTLLHSARTALLLS
jgi:hypothetical protein